MLQQPINRISQVVYCLRPENFDEAVRFLAEALGVEFHDASNDDLGLRIMISLENGIEMITPAPDRGPVPERFTRFLEEKGEGVYNIVYGVENADEVAERAQAMGVGVTHRSSFADLPAWRDRMKTLVGIHLEPVHGMKITIGQVEPNEAFEEQQCRYR